MIGGAQGTALMKNGNKISSVADLIVDAAVRRVGNNGKIYTFRSDRYFRFSDAASIPTEIDNSYPEVISGNGYAGVPTDLDAAVVASKDSKLYLFKGNLLYHFTDSKSRVENGYPKKISEEWPRIPDNLDAALLYDGSTYFFKDDKFWLWNDAEDQVANGYPKSISEEWLGIPSNVDAAMTDLDGNAYFFVGKQYYKYQSDNYPRSVCEDFPGLCF
jgi:hypothetical protein